MRTFVLVLIVSSEWEATYRFDEVLHSRSVVETVKETDGSSGDAQSLLFGDVIIKSDSADVAWVAFDWTRPTNHAGGPHHIPVFFWEEVGFYTPHGLPLEESCGRS